MRYSISENDYRTKLRNAARLLADGCKIRLVMPMRGREMVHQNLALDLSLRFIAELSGISACEFGPVTEGKCVVAVISPTRKVGS